MSSFNFGTGQGFDFANVPINATGGAPDSDDEAVEDPGPSEVIEGRLYVGTKFDANDAKLQERGFTHVLCCMSGSARPIEGITRLLLPMCDRGTTDVFDEVVDGAVPFLKGAMDEPGSKTLVHCSQGINRSATVLCTFFMVAHKMPLKEAYALVVSHRPQTCMHDRYVEQLRKLDLHLFGTASTAEDELLTTSKALAAARAAYADM